MYVIVEKAKLEGKFFGIMNTLPDGRVYIPISEMRNVGTLLDIDIIGSARELKEFSVTPGEEEEIDPGFSQEPNPDSDSGASEEGNGSVTGPEQPAGAKTDGKRKGGQR